MCEKLLDELNEEFAEELSLMLVDPDDVREWGCSSNLKFKELVDAYFEPEKLELDVRGMPIWHFCNVELALDLYVVDLEVQNLLLMFNAYEPRAGRLLELP